MIARFEQWILRVLRVPPEPEAPPGDSGSIRQFRAGRNFYLYKVVTWVLGQIAPLAGLIVGALFIRSAVDSERARAALLWLEVAAAAGFLLQIPFTFAVMRLDYRMRWYTVTDRSLRIREGVLTVEEKTVTFANIQNLQVKQGPIQRLLGIADVQVQTAGGGASEKKKNSGENPFAKDMHTAYFRGVDNAVVIRDMILARLRAHRSAGLGDPDDVHDQPAGMEAAAVELRAAALALREAASRL
jgi:membrane protein YdbS with pleckstrin-like domain